MQRVLRVPVALLVGLLGPLVYIRILLPGWAPAGYDLVTYFYPLRHYLALAWAGGRPLPLWSSDTFLGVPYLANIQTAVLYPPNLLFAILPTEHALGWLIAGHLAVAGAGTYAFVRRGERLPAPAAAVAAAVYMLGGYMDSHIGHLNQSNTLAWTPWLMLAAARCAVRPRARTAVAVAILAALVLLAGHTQQAYFSFLLAAGVALVRLWERRRRGWRRSLTAAAAALGGVLLGAGLAAAQLVPTAELSTGASSRSGGLDLAAAGQFSLPLPAMLVSQLPDYLTQQPTEYTAYAGLVALALAAFGVAAAWRRPRVLILVAAGLAGVLAATGPHGFVYDAGYYGLPGLRYFRVPARLLLFTSVSAGLLAAHGVAAAIQLARAQRHDRWRRHGALALASAATAMLLTVGLGSRLGTWIFVEGRTTVRPTPAPFENAAGWALFAVLGLGGLLLLLRLHRKAQTAAWLLAGAVVIELVVASAPTEARNPLPDLVYHPDSSAADLFPPDLDHRYVSLARSDYTVALPAGYSAYQLSPADAARAAGFLTSADHLQPDIGLGSGRATADGYDGGVLPTAAYVRFRTPVLPPGAVNESDYTIRLVADRVYSLDWLREAGVAGVIASEGQDPNPPGCRSGCLVETMAAGHLRLWTFPAGAPTRAWVIDGAGSRVAATVEEDTGERLRIRAPVAGTLWIADAYLPGWKATVGGRPVAVRTEDGFRRVVSVESAPAEVVMSYEPASAHYGIALSLMSLAVLLGLTAVPFYKRR